MTMVFAEFQVMSTGWNGRDFSGPAVPVPALGSDGVFRLDRRKGLDRQVRDARERMESLRALHPGYVGFRLFAGTSYSDCRPLGGGRLFLAGA